MRRAGGETEKLERRNQILSLADSLCQSHAYEEIRMTDLAHEAGIAKGTLYLYFPSKESLFLALSLERLNTVFAEIENRLSMAGAGKLNASLLAHIVAAGISKDLCLPRLLSDLHSELEKRVPYKEALEFKQRLAGYIEKAGSALSKLYPVLSPESAKKFFLYLYAQIVGLSHLTDISPFMKKISSEPGLEVFKLGFAESLEESARLFLQGLELTGSPALARQSAIPRRKP